ncbi:MAG: hypothetical protein ABII97_00875 [Patescibacteria group bacterium]
MSPRKDPRPKDLVDKRLMELIETGILLDDGTYTKLHEQISSEFPDNKFDKRSFKTRIFNLLFIKQKALDDTLQDIVRLRLGTNKTIRRFKSVYPFVPEDLVEKRAQWHRGLVSGRAKKLMGKNLPGIGRIDLSGGMPDFKIPRTSFKKPFKITLKGVKNWSIMILNGANLGIKHGANIVGNIARKVLSDAEAHKDQAVILTNFLSFDLKKAGGPAKTARAQVLGDNINPDLIQDPEYRKIVRKIIADKPMDQIAFRTVEELVNDVLGGWTKIGTKPNGRPEYSRGSVYVIIGLNELALISAVTYWEIRWWTVKRQKELDGEIRLLKKTLDSAKKVLDSAESAGSDINEAYEKVSDLNAKLESLRHQRARTTISDVANQESQRFFEHAYSVVVQKIEEAIPGAKVIGEGTTFLRINKRVTRIEVPAHLRVTDGLLNDYCKIYGPDILREESPDAVIITHPWSTGFRVTGRETDHDGQRDSMKVFVAPIAVDEEYLRLELSTLRIKDHPIVKAVYNPLFSAGAMRLRSSNGVLDADEIPARTLESFKNYPLSRITKNTTGSSVYKRGSEYIWFMACSDQHWGGRSKEFVWDKKREIRVGMAEAVFEMMRREGLCKGTNMPIHFLLSPDDPVQGQNHPYRTEPHPQQMPYDLIERLTGDLLNRIRETKDKGEAIKLAEEMRRFSLFQFEKRASDYVFEQMMQMMHRHIQPNLDVFSAILRRAQKANIVIQGVGNFVIPEFAGYDTRNAGLINIGTGNHFGNTVERELIEGPFYAQRLRDLLGGLEEWKRKTEFLQKSIVAPIYGSGCIGWAVISVKDKHQYGFEVRAAPTNMAGWGDPLRGHVNRDVQRGNYSKIWNGKLPVIKFFGDKHFFSGISTSYSIYHMSPASVGTDAYGERGFTPNNTGVSFLGVPADGPRSGPILWRCLPFDVVKSFMEKPKRFDWKEFLPNPV